MCVISLAPFLTEGRLIPLAGCCKSAGGAGLCKEWRFLYLTPLCKLDCVRRFYLRSTVDWFCTVLNRIIIVLSCTNPTTFLHFFALSLSHALSLSLFLSHADVHTHYFTHSPILQNQNNNKNTLFNNRNAQRFTDKCTALTTVYKKTHTYRLTIKSILFNNHAHYLTIKNTTKQSHTLVNNRTHYLTTKAPYLTIECTLFHWLWHTIEQISSATMLHDCRTTATNTQTW